MFLQISENRDAEEVIPSIQPNHTTYDNLKNKIEGNILYISTFQTMQGDMINGTNQSCTAHVFYLQKRQL